MESNKVCRAHFIPRGFSWLVGRLKFIIGKKYSHECTWELQNFQEAVRLSLSLNFQPHIQNFQEAVRLLLSLNFQPHKFQSWIVLWMMDNTRAPTFCSSREKIFNQENLGVCGLGLAKLWQFNSDSTLETWVYIPDNINWLSRALYFKYMPQEELQPPNIRVGCIKVGHIIDYKWSCTVTLIVISRK